MLSNSTRPGWASRESLPTICGGRVPACATPPGGEMEQIQFLLGHVSVQTTEKCVVASSAFAKQ